MTTEGQILLTEGRRKLLGLIDEHGFVTAKLAEESGAMPRANAGVALKTGTDAGVFERVTRGVYRRGPKAPKL